MSPAKHFSSNYINFPSANCRFPHLHTFTLANFKLETRNNLKLVLASAILQKRRANFSLTHTQKTNTEFICVAAVFHLLQLLKSCINNFLLWFPRATLGCINFPRAHRHSFHSLETSTHTDTHIFRGKF